MIYSLFISHSWDYPQHYEKLKEYFDRRLGFLPMTIQ